MSFDDAAGSSTQRPTQTAETGDIKEEVKQEVQLPPPPPPPATAAHDKCVARRCPPPPPLPASARGVSKFAVPPPPPPARASAGGFAEHAVTPSPLADEGHAKHGAKRERDHGDTDSDTD